MECKYFVWMRNEWVEEASKFDKDFIEIYDEDSHIACFIEADVQYLEELYERHNDLPILTDRMKTEKFEKPVANLHDKKE